MTPTEMRHRIDDLGEDPLDVSIVKWEEIVANKGDGNYIPYGKRAKTWSPSEDCGLCYRFQKNNECSLCPARGSTAAPSSCCKGHYMTWVCYSTTETAQAVLDFLRKLKEKEVS